MKKLLSVFVYLSAICPSYASITATDSLWVVAGGTTPADLIAIYCNPYMPILNADTQITYSVQNCVTPVITQIYPVPVTGMAISTDMKTLLGSATMTAAKSAMFTGTTAQYVRGDGSLATLPTGSRTFNYPSRALNSCFQISSTQDSDFHYKIDVSSGAVLSSTATGTVTATSYTNSGCTTGAQVVADGAPSQGAALGILSVSQVAPVGIDGTLPANHWMKITTAQTLGTPTFAIRSVQSETLLP